MSQTQPLGPSNSNSYRQKIHQFLPFLIIGLILVLALLVLFVPDKKQQNTVALAPITIGSKIDTEGGLLCQMIKVALEDHQIIVNDKCNTGVTQVVREALLQAEIDLYPEYTGNAPYLITDVKFDPNTFKNAKVAYETVAKTDLAKNKIVWLKPAPANNTFTIAIPKKMAASANISSFADFADYVNQANPVKLIASQEFIERADGLKSFEKFYQFHLKPDQLVVVAGGNTAQAITAAARGTNGINAAMAYGTDGQISALNMVALTDPRGAVEVYQPSVSIRQSVLAAYPELKNILEPIFATLSATTLSTLNAKIVVGGESSQDVATQYLKQKGFIR